MQEYLDDSINWFYKPNKHKTCWLHRYGEEKKIWVSLTPLFNMIKNNPEVLKPQNYTHRLLLPTTYRCSGWRVVAIKRDENSYE